MMVKDKLSILEEKLNNLFNEYMHVKQERDELLSKYEALQSHIKDIEAENNLLKQSKEVVKAKIERMLQKLDA